MSGGYGGGGEYDVQLGFGWSNGVVMDFLYKYGNELSLDFTNNEIDKPEEIKAEHPANISKESNLQISTVLLAVIVSLMAGFIG